MTRSACHVRHVIIAIAFACSAVVARAQSPILGPDFVNDYTVTELFAAPGVVPPYGGLTFKDGDPNTLIVAGPAENVGATLYEVPVTRDASGHIVGFAATATGLASAPDCTGGLRYGPGGVLFYTAYATNMLGQIKPGSTVTDKLIDLTALGVTANVGGIEFVPNGFPNAGHLKITSYGGDQLFDAEVVPDGSGTYDVVNLSPAVQLAPVGPESMMYVDAALPAFSAQSVLICEWYTETVGAYEIDANGDALPGTRRDFFACCGYWPLGSAVDPLTGDFVIADDGSGNNIVVVRVTPGTSIGTAFCSPAATNSTGLPAVLSATGSDVIADNNVDFVVDQLPLNQFGYFVMGDTQGFIAVGQGFLCMSLPFVRFNQDILDSGSAGEMLFSPDLANLPAGTVFSIGDSWNFQCWYRDLNPGNTSNLSNGIEIVFQ